MKKIILLVILLVLALPTIAQTIEVTGTVKDMQNKPLSDVIIKVTSGKTTLAFVSSNSKGAYSLSFDSKKVKEPAVLSFTHISYVKDEIVLPTDKRKLVQDTWLEQKTIALKEVKVKAPPLTILGDTLTYNLASFLKKGDVTLEDGLKNLPGIDISKNGAISYMGKGISNFYIGGLDMLGGRYNLATKNIPAEYATQVEIMKHHKHRKIDADEESDAVAINVKLSNKAKFKPFGQPEFGVGETHPNPPCEGGDAIRTALLPSQGRLGGVLYAAGATEMMFTDNFQLLAAAKYSNNGNFGIYDMVNHYGGDDFGSLATDKLPAWGQVYAGGVGESVYRRNGYGSLNAIQKIDSVRQIKVNADYTYERMTSNGSSESFYFADGENIHIAESTNPLAKTHRPMFSIKFENNASNHYFADNFSAKAQFLRHENDVYSTAADDGLLAMQRRKSTSINLDNNFWGTVRMGKKKLSFTSDIGFTRTPNVLMTMNDITQSGQSTQIYTRHSTSLQVKLGKWKIDTPVELVADYNFIETDLMKPGLDDQRQRMNGWKLVPQVSPSTSWTSSDKKFYAAMGVRMKWLNLSYLSHCDDKRTTLTEPFAEPNLSMRYTFSGTSELNFSSGFNHSAGDMMDLLTTPVQLNYRSTTAASGVIGKSQSWSTSLRYSKQVPFSYFTFGANASYNQGKRNVLSSRNVSQTATESTSIFRDSHTRSASGGINASKNILSLFTKLSASADASWGSSEYMMQSKFVTAYHTGYSLHLQADITPISWLELNAKGDYGKDWSRTTGTKQSSDNLRCSGSVAVFPMPKLEIRSTFNFMHNMVEPNKYKDTSMLSASLQYKAKHAVWKLSGDNLLDVRQYTRTSFMDTDRFVHTTNLVGRTVMLTCKLLLTSKSNK